MALDINSIVYVGLNSHVAAIDRNTGETNRVLNWLRENAAKEPGK